MFWKELCSICGLQFVGFADLQLCDTLRTFDFRINHKTLRIFDLRTGTPKKLADLRTCLLDHLCLLNVKTRPIINFFFRL
jgi:hypothetical protein